MAITINSTPESYPSMHDDLWFVVTSTNVASTNFKFVFEVYVNSTLVATVKSFPDPTTNKGFFNAASIVRSYASSYFNPNTTQTLFSYNGDDIYVSYEVRYGEEYAATTYLNLTSATYKAFNFYPALFRDPSTSYFSPYVSKWITSRDRTAIECGYTEKCYASFMNAAGTTQATTATVQLYNADGSASGSPSTGSSTTMNSFGLLDISPAAINAYLGSTFIPSTAYGYGIKLNYASTSSEELKVVISCNLRYTPVPMHFLNQLGGYDTYSFRLLSRESRSMEKKSYEQMNWQYNSGSTSVRNYDSYKKMNAGTNAFSVSQTAAFKLNSDYVSVQDYGWLRELIASPEVYMEKDGYYHPVAVKTASWEEKLRIADKMFNLELDVEYGRKLNSQYK